MSAARNSLLYRTGVAALVAAVALLPGGCLDLDSFLCGEEALSSYKLDSYGGERECDSYVDQAGPMTSGWVRQVSMQSGGHTIYGLFLHHDSICTPQDTLLLYFHGKGAHLDYYWPRVRLLHDAGRDSADTVPRYAVLAIDFRGFGMSDGEPTQAGLLEDGRAAFRYVKEALGAPKVIAYGYSLGSCVAVNLAAESADSEVVRLVLEAPVGSAAGLVDDGAYLAIPGDFVTDWDFSNIERIRDVSQPLYWMHGTNDGTVGIEKHGQPIWDNYAGADGACVKVPGGEHRTVPQTLGGGYAGYQRALRLNIQGASRANASLYTEFKP